MDIDDNDSFKRLFSEVTPIKSKPTVKAFKPRPKPVPVKQPEFYQPLASEDIEVVPVLGTDRLQYCDTSIRPKTFRQLKQGKLIIDTKIDLHRLTTMEAELMLDKFIQSALNNHCKVVEIIHGKGLSSSELHPPLKNLVNCYLHQNPYILAFTSAPQHLGGTGSTLVLLKSGVTIETY